MIQQYESFVESFLLHLIKRKTFYYIYFFDQQTKRNITIRGHRRGVPNPLQNEPQPFIILIQYKLIFFTDINY